MCPQLLRLNADILCLQEVNGQEGPGQPRTLLALESLIADTPYAGFHRASTVTADAPGLRRAQPGDPQPLRDAEPQDRDPQRVAPRRIGRLRQRRKVPGVGPCPGGSRVLDA